MLQAIRGKTGGWIAKIFMGLLALSFAVWGIADVFTVRTDDVLVKVGEREITSEAFRQTFNQQLRALSQRAGETITPDQARTLGLDRQILGDMMREAAVEAQADALGVITPGLAVARAIAANPQFQGADGSFNPAGFRRLLASNGLTEEEFVASEGRSMTRREIAGTVGSGLAVPDTLVEMIWRQRNEQRDVSYFTVTDDGTVPEPSDSELKSFYDANPGLFTLPERREFVAVVATPETLASQVRVSEEELAAAYERRKLEYGTPEMRVVQQITFGSPDEARAAAERIRSGTDFLAVARERNLSETDVSLGAVAKDALPDPAIAEAAFALALNQVSEPVTGRLSTVLVRVTAITPADQKSLDEVRGDLTHKVQLDHARDRVVDIHDKFEDARAAGASMEEAAREVGLAVERFGPVGRDGTTADGTAMTGLPGVDQVLETVFASDVGLEVQPISADRDGLVWIETREVQPSTVQDFAASRERAVAAWKTERRQARLKERAETLRKRLEAGETLAKLAAEAGAAVRAASGIKRNEASADFDSTAVGAVFAEPADGFAVALENDGRSIKIMQSRPVLGAPFDRRSQEAEAIGNVLRSNLANDLYAQYVAQLQEQLGVSINDQLWRRVSGGQ